LTPQYFPRFPLRDNQKQAIIYRLKFLIRELVDLRYIYDFDIDFEYHDEIVVVNFYILSEALILREVSLSTRLFFSNFRDDDYSVKFMRILLSHYNIPLKE